MSGLSSKESSSKKLKKGIEFSLSAPGKVILHGEHSVIYGKLAFAGSLDLKTKINLVEIDTPNTFVFKIIPLDFDFAFKITVLEKLLLDKPPALTSDVSSFNWECPKLIDFDAQIKVVNEAIHSVFESTFSGRKNILNALRVLFYFFSGILASTIVKVSPLYIRVDSELEMGAGTGSSASFCVALAATMIHYLKLISLDDKNISRAGYKDFAWTKQEVQNTDSFSERQLKRISQWAYSAEKIFHGNPSGLDNTICTYGNFVKFRKNEKPEVLRLSNTSFNILLINTRIYRETSRLVTIVAERQEQFPTLVNHILEAMEDLTKRAIEFILKIDSSTGSAQFNAFNDLETLIQMNHGLLCALGVSHQRLEEVIMILEDHGLKGKLTGAGGGGFAFSILPLEFEPDQVMRALRLKGFGVFGTKLGTRGVLID